MQLSKPIGVKHVGPLQLHVNQNDEDTWPKHAMHLPVFHPAHVFSKRRRDEAHACNACCANMPSVDLMPAVELKSNTDTYSFLRGRMHLLIRVEPA